MATSFSIYTSCLLVLTLSLTTTQLFLPTNGLAAADEVCIGTTKPEVCLQALVGETYQDKTLENLVSIGVERAISQAVLCRSESKRLFDKTTDPHLKASYGLCERQFDDAVTRLTAAKDDVKERRWLELHQKAERVRGDVHECEKGFEGLSSVDRQGFQLTVDAEAIRTVSDFLASKK